MNRSNVFACRFADGWHYRSITIWWEPPTPPDQRDTCSAHNVDNSNAMDLVDADNKVVVVDDEDVMAANDAKLFCISNSWWHASNLL
jgi:hypothetical protein